VDRLAEKAATFLTETDIPTNFPGIPGVEALQYRPMPAT
jgi:hypothetical protein